MRSVRTITVDLDDTLWEIGPVIRRAEKRLHGWLAEYYPRVPELFPADAVKALRREVIEAHRDKLHDLTFLRKAVLARMSAAAGYPEALADEAFAVFDEARNEVELFPDVVPALESLGRRYVLIAVTNGNADLGRIGIAALFDTVICARSIGAAKPARSIFAAAVHAGGAEPHETLHVGDHPEHDVFGARRAGLKAVWLNRGGGTWPDEMAPPDHEVADMSQLEALLADSKR